MFCKDERLRRRCIATPRSDVYDNGRRATYETMAAGDVYDNGRRTTYGTMAAGDVYDKDSRLHNTRDQIQRKKEFISELLFKCSPRETIPLCKSTAYIVRYFSIV